jgi:uncharacterized lipoprotein YehR (DUF1307 family)
MKVSSKNQILSKMTLCKVALVVFMGFSRAACGEKEKEKTVKGTVTVNADGEILFM